MKKLTALLLPLALLIALTLCVSAATMYASSANALKDAFTSLKSTGGTVILTSDFTVSTACSLPANSKPITIDGNDYTITLANNIAFNGDVDVKNVTFANSGTYRSLPCNGHNVHFFDTVSCEKASGSSYYPSIMAGYTASTAFTSGTVTIDGGTWQRVRAGNAGTSSVKQCSTVIVNGGTFAERFQCGGAGSMASGSTVDVTLNGGTYNGGVMFFTPGTGNVTCDAVLTVNGGTFKDTLRIVDGDVTGSVGGSVLIDIRGGDFAQCTGINGYTATGLNVQTKVTEAMADTKFNLDEVTDTLFGTKVHDSMADPWLFTYNGYYYLTATGSTKIGLIKSPTVSGLTGISITSNIIYDSANDPTLDALGYDKLSGTWSPEIHYYSDEDFPGNSGWYMFLALRANTGDSSDIQMVVLKSKTDSPDGPYANPVTGEIGCSQPVLDKSGRRWSDWGCGQSTLTVPTGTYKGVYALWVSEYYRGTSSFHQEVKIAKMKTPWQFSTADTSIITPTQSWEKNGSGLIGGTYYPKVVEGATEVHGDHGEIYLIYCGSGYWANYGLGQMTLKMSGSDYMDPLSADSWVKYTNNPTFSANDKNGSHYTDVLLQGAGHASFFTDAEGSRFLCYHAYPSDKYGDKGTDPSRNAYVEPYTIDYTATSTTAPYGLVKMGVRNTNRPAATSTNVNFITSCSTDKTITGLADASANMEIIPTTPAAPVLGTPAVEQGEITLSWTMSNYKDGDSFKIYRDNVLLATVKTFSYTDTVTAVGSYTYSVTAVHSTTTSTATAESAPITVTLTQAAPEIGWFLLYRDNSICLKAFADEASDGADTCILYRSTDGENFEEVDRAAPSVGEVAQTLSDNDLSENATYYYYLCTAKGSEIGFPSETVTVTVPTVPVISGFTAVQNGKDVTLCWTVENPQAGDLYSIRRHQNGVTGPNPEVGTITEGMTSYTDSSVPEADEYIYYLIISRSYLAVQATTEITVKPLAPTAEATAESGKISVKVTAADDYDRVILYRAAPGEDLEQYLAEDVTLAADGSYTFTDTAVECGMTYTYAASGSYTGVESPLSAAVTAALPLPVPPAPFCGPGSYVPTQKQGVAVYFDDTDCGDMQGYVYYRSTDMETFTEIARSPFSTYIDTDVEDGVTYFYKVACYLNDEVGELSAPSEYTFKETPDTPTVSDLTGDGKLDIEDVLYSLRSILDGDTEELPDMNGDGKFTLVDVLRILKQAAI